MPKTSDRAKRSGSDPIIIGSSKIATDSNNDISIVDTSGNAKKVIASEVHLGTGSDKVILKRSSSDGKLQLQTTDGSSTSNSEVSGDSGGAGGVTVQEEGSALSTTATTLNFVGSSVTASGSGETKTITISAGTGGTTTVYANINAMTASSPSAGDQALVTANAGLYIYNGGGWYKIATVNTNPTISSPSSGTSYALASDGSATSIELVGADADPGTTFQNSYAVTTGSLTNGGGTTATITSSATADGTFSALSPSTNTTNRFFKITGTTNSSHGGSFTLTFSMSDGISAATTVQSFSLSFVTTNGAYHFTTTSSRLTASSSDFNISSSTPFTIEFWYQLKSGSGDGVYLMDMGTGNMLSFSKYQNKMQPYSSQIGGFWAVPTVGVGVTLDTWYHLCVSGDGSGNTKYFIDGTQQGNTHNGTWAISGGKIRINGFAGSGYTNIGAVSYISDFRLVNGTQVYSSNFTKPSSPLTAITNTKLLTCQNSSGSLVDNSGSNHTLTTNGTVTPRAGVP